MQSSHDQATFLSGVSEMVLAAATREYPNHVQHTLRSDADAGTPRRFHPAFYGSFDWHSAVHSHWCLVRLLRLFPGLPNAVLVRAVLERHLASAPLENELQYLQAPGRRGFERPYGLAWLLQLAAELREWRDPQAAVWAQHLGALEQLAAERLLAYVRKLPRPVRTGEHSQTAFALGLAWDWATIAEEAAYRKELAEACSRLFGADRAAPVAYEPGGTDFLSPALAQADLLRRTMEAETFGSWLEAFLPDPAGSAFATWLEPVQSVDRSDGKLAHWDGLNLSRAWMLEGIVSALAPGHPLRAPLEAAAGRHRGAGLSHAVTDEYMGSHWLGSFAVYLVTERGLPPAGESPLQGA